jgi:hypothetical protein
LHHAKEKAGKNSTIANFQFFCNLQKYHNAHNNIQNKFFVMSLRKELRKNEEEGGCHVCHPLSKRSFNKTTIEEVPCDA